LKTASTTAFSAAIRCACASEPIRPCSSPAHPTKTSVASNSMPLSANLLASSIVSTVPLPLSLAPCASTSKSWPGCAIASKPGGSGAGLATPRV
jgi:hypothetical protein